MADIAEFDERGLWFFRDIGFSRAGTLKQTVVLEVEHAPEGRTHAELRDLLRARAHNTLLGLIWEGRLAREPFDGLHLYVSADAEQAARQMERRTAGVTGALRAPTPEETIEILVEALRAAPQVPPAALVAKRLPARGVRVEGHQIQQVFAVHGLRPEKNGAAQLAALSALKSRLHSLQGQCRQRMRELGGSLGSIAEEPQPCPLCGGPVILESG